MYIYIYTCVCTYEGKKLISCDHPLGRKKEKGLYMTCHPQNRVLSMNQKIPTKYHGQIAELEHTK